MSGFDNGKVDEEFFAAGKPCFGCEQEIFPESHVKSNFLCNLGYGDPSTLPRLPRLPFKEACTLLKLRCTNGSPQVPILGGVSQLFQLVGGACLVRVLVFLSRLP
jgi:hypothetical protein